MIEPVNDNILNLVNELYNNLDAKDKIINEQALEIARLNNEIQLRIKSIEKLENDIIEYQRDRARLKEENNKVRELVKNYEELEKMLGAGQPRFPLYKLQEILGDNNGK